MEASGTKEMTWTDEVLQNAYMRLKQLDEQIGKLEKEKLDVLSVIRSLEGNRKKTVKEKPARRRLTMPKRNEMVAFTLYGRRHYLNKAVIKTLLSLRSFTTPKVVAQVRKWHRTSSHRSAYVIAKLYIGYLKQNGFIVEKPERKGLRLWYKVNKEKKESLAALVEGL